MKRKPESTIQMKPQKSLRAPVFWTSLLLIGAGILFMAGKAQPKNEAAEVVELAIYKVHADQIANYPAARAQMLAALKTFSGYRSGQTFRAVSDATIFVDYFTWATLEDAREAARQLEHRAEAQAFLHTIDSLLVYNHSTLVADGLILGRAHHVPSTPDDIAEIAVYRVPQGSQEDLLSERPAIFGMIKRYDGFRSGRTARAVEDTEVIVDFVQWTDLATAEKADSEVTSTPEAESYFGKVTAITFFDRLKPLRHHAQ